MIIQCAADFHGNEERYIKFFRGFEKEKPDVVILPGDLGYLNEDMFDISVPAFAVHGNMDGLLMFKKIEMVDGKIFSFNGINFIGIGWNTKFFGIDAKANFDIIISHVPPYKIKDKTFLGMHIGSKWLRKIVEEKKPKFVLCGHVHEDYGYEKFNDTIVVNCSIGKKGEYTIIDTDRNEIRMIGYD
ncbi:MAG: metallophosphoesterase [Thermoplasmata archaeon]|nr:metallophosphoesterase [Thermoplasmata archaeon]